MICIYEHVCTLFEAKSPYSVCSVEKNVTEYW